MKFLLSRLVGFRKRMLIGFTIKVAGTMVELFLPYILSHILENVIGSLDMAQIVFFGILMIFCAATARRGFSAALSSSGRVPGLSCEHSSFLLKRRKSACPSAGSGTSGFRFPPLCLLATKAPRSPVGLFFRLFSRQLCAATELFPVRRIFSEFFCCSLLTFVLDFS